MIFIDTFATTPGARKPCYQISDFYRNNFGSSESLSDRIHTVYEYSYFADRSLGIYIPNNKKVVENIELEKSKYLEFNKDLDLIELIVFSKTKIVEERHQFVYNSFEELTEYLYWWSTKGSYGRRDLNHTKYIYNFSPNSKNILSIEFEERLKRCKYVYDYPEPIKKPNGIMVPNTTPIGFKVYKGGTLFTTNKFIYDKNNELVKLKCYNLNGDLIETISREYRGKYIKEYEEINTYNKDGNIIESKIYNNEIPNRTFEHFIEKDGLKSYSKFIYGINCDKDRIIEKHIKNDKRNYDGKIEEIKQDEFTNYNKYGDPLEIINEYGIISYKYKYNKKNKWTKRIAKYNYHGEPIRYLITKRRISYFSSIAWVNLENRLVFSKK